MPVNPNLEAPTFRAVVQSDSTIISPSLRGIDLWAEGTFKLQDVLGNVYGPYTATAPFPVRITGQINKVFNTDTTIADADMVGLQ